MRGAGILYNTYSVRYARGQTTFDRAVENTRTQFEAAESADVGKVVHSSVAKTSCSRPVPDCETGATYRAQATSAQSHWTALGRPSPSMSKRMGLWQRSHPKSASASR